MVQNSNMAQKININIIKITAIVMLLILIASVLGYLYRQSPLSFVNRGAGHLRAMIYFGLIIAWGLSVSKRIMQKRVRFYLMFISILMIYWLLARTMRYLFVIKNVALRDFLWYTYYIPIVLIPLIGMFVALYLGKTEDYRLSKWMRFLYIPAVILIILVLTNNLHEQVFVFVEGDAALRTDYEYRFGYWLIFAWMLIFAMAMFSILIAKSRVPRSKKILWLPFVPFLIYFVYAVLYAIRVPLIHILIGDMTVVFCMLIIGIFESCIRVGLIRSNTKYAELLYASGIAAQIVDMDYKVHYKGASAQPLSKDIMRRAQLGPIDLDGATRLSSVAISGGHALWMEDISEMNRIRSELKEVRERLSENNELLQAELELKERQAAVDEKDRLYDKVTEKVSPQLQRLNGLLSDNSVEDIPVREKLIWLCILGTYIKRCSNLIILSEENNFISAKELEYCLLESVEAISACGINCALNRKCDGVLAAEDALLLYGLFEEIVEMSLAALSDLFVTVTDKGNIGELKMQVCCGKGYTLTDDIKGLSHLESRGGYMEKLWEDGILHISIKLPKRGAEDD